MSDQFGFEQHYTNLVQVLKNKGINVTEQDGFDGDCVSVPQPSDDYLLIRYNGGHVGIPAADDVTNQLLNGAFCSSLIVWQRLLTMIGWLDQHFPGGASGPQGLRPNGDFELRALPSPALTPAGMPTVMRTVGIYRPPAHYNTNDTLPIVYFLGGYGQDPGDFSRVQLLLDTLIDTGAIQNMYFVFLPGDGAWQGSFYVNHVVPTDQVPTLPASTGRYEDSIIQDLIPQIERQVLPGRIATE